MNISNQKLIQAGNYLHLYTFNQTFQYNYENPKKSKIYKDPELQISTSETQTNFYRAKKNIKLLFQTNVQTAPQSNIVLPCTQFITFTFAEKLTDFRQANYLYTKFTKRLTYFLTKKKTSFLKYIAVPELQKRGAIHYHTTYFNLPFIKNSYDTIRKLWTQNTKGTANQETIKGDIQQLANYVTKYITKQKLPQNTRTYFPSRNLQRPTLYRDKDTIRKIIPTNYKPIFTKTYTRQETNLVTQYALYQTN